MYTKEKTIKFIQKDLKINSIDLIDWLGRQIALRSPVLDDYDAGFKDCLTALKEHLSFEVENLNKR